MPFERNTLSELRTQVAADIASALPGTDPLLRYSNLWILGQVLAGMSHLHYGYLDWIAKQAVPYTATDEYLESWAALVGVTRKAASSASGSVTFSGTNGAVIPAGTQLVRSDGTQFTTVGSVNISSGTAIVTATANSDPSGLTGVFGNTAIGSTLTLGSPIIGVQSSGTVTTAFTGGSDLETDDDMRSRMLSAFQNPSQGGSASDYVNWALQVPGVTRAWCVPNGMGSGTVQVYVMLDQSEAAYGGFPQGTNGVATLETRGAAATGDQLAVANYIYPLRPVTALVYAVAPTANTVNFTISGLSSASSTVKANVNAAIDSVFLQYGTLAGVVALSYIESAIAAVAGTAGFVITSPSTNISSGSGQIPVRGTTTWT